MIKFKTLAMPAAIILSVSACTSIAPGPVESPGAQTPPMAPLNFVANDRFAAVAAATTAVDKDRTAILAMQGEYSVTFRFEETVTLKNGYERQAPKDAGAFETVVVLEESADSVVLQHMLVTADGQVIKHWRQDWHYEPEEHFVFVADQRWEVQAFNANSNAGQWTQCVYEVSDAPRYCGAGRWNHNYGVSTWTSDRSWRPLPRREYTVRSDYNALNVENRHTVTPQGWTHEQDNTKVLRNGKQTETTLVREFGFNDYRRIDGFDFQPAYQYWDATAPYWANVRTAWATFFDSDGYVELATDVSGMPVIQATFAQADEVKNGAESPTAKDVESLLSKWVNRMDRGV